MVHLNKTLCTPLLSSVTMIVLKEGILTQLGGCLVLSGDKKIKYEWRDEGICHVANFEDILKKI